MNENILEIRGVTKKFPGVIALNDISFKVKKGSIHAICGENGAGKSTLMKILAGIHPQQSYSGTIYFDGERLEFSGDSIKQAGEKGIAIVHQELALVPQVTVGENVFLGREPTSLAGINWNKLYTDTKKLLEQYKLDIPFSGIVEDLSVGKQQMVEIAKSLSEDAKLLILDEPTSALTDSEVTTLMRILRELRDQGKTCLYISHKLEEVFEISDEITVFRDGTVVDTVETSEVDAERIIAMMVGREMTERFPSAEHKPGEVILKVDSFSVESPEHPGKNAVEDVSFELRQGEILGIAGLMGSGRSELATAIFGEFGKKHKGEISLNGNRVNIRSARDAMHHGIGFVPEDRKQKGLVIQQTILKNISLPSLDQFSTRLSVNKHKEVRKSEEIAKELSVKTPSLHALVSSLSGGNQQKVVIAKWLLTKPRILFLDEPTRGIDVGAKYEIYKLMHKLTGEGLGIIMISSELPEILGMSDRILVMHEGRQSGILNRKEATQEKIMALATGLA